MMENVLQKFMEALASFLKSSDARATHTQQGLMSALDKSTLDTLADSQSYTDMLTKGLKVRLNGDDFTYIDLPMSALQGDRIYIKPYDTMTNAQKETGVVTRYVKHEDALIAYETGESFEGSAPASIGLKLGFQGTKLVIVYLRHNF